MKRVYTRLTADEREALVLSARCLTNTEIAESLGTSVINVKTLVHSACLKMGAHTRYAAAYSAIMRGDIGLDEFLSPDESAARLHGLAPDVLSRMAEVVRQGARREILRMIDEGVLHLDRKEDTILTERQRDVLRLVGRGLTNREIAEKLFISASRVRNVLNEACSKLGARSRAEAYLAALRRGDIEIGEVVSHDEMVRCLTRLKPESLKKIAQLLGEEIK